MQDFYRRYIVHNYDLMILKKLASQLINVWERSEKWSSTWILELHYPKKKF